MAKELDVMEKIVSLCKRKGFVYQGSEIYGGLAGTWDYGPLGIELKNNIKNIWWRMFVQNRDDMYGLDAAILMSPKVWEASGHVAGFSDPEVQCLNCNKPSRADHLLEKDSKYWNFLGHVSKTIRPILNEEESLADDWESILNIFESKLEENELPDQKEKKELEQIKAKFAAKSVYSKYAIKELEKAIKFTGSFAQRYLDLNTNCPNCGERKWAEPRQFNMMFQTQIGATEGSISYLRPETAGGIFVNFKNVVDSFHPKLPFGIGQIGKAFRNEIAPRDFIFRVRELEQMEIEYFVRPTEWESAFEEWRQGVHAFNKAVGIPAEAVHELEVADGDRAHYSKRTIDFEFDFPFGRKELYGLAYRTDFDLSAHQKGSSQDLSYRPEGEEPFIPHVIEPSFGVDRTFLAVLSAAYTEDEIGGEPRAYLKLAPSVAPVKAMVAPLLKNKPELVAKAREVYSMIKKDIPQIVWDDNGNIGKRYRRQDEIGTPFCITVDFDTLENQTVTVRHRDTGAQERVEIEELPEFLGSRIKQGIER